MKFIKIGPASLLIQPYKILPSIKTFLRNSHFISFFISFIFIAHFSWACMSLCVSRNFYLKHSFCNNSLISSWISSKFVSALLLCMLYQTNNFQHTANISMYLRDTFITEPLSNDVNKISDTQTTLI